MRHMLLNKFLRNDKNTEAPSNWPDNIIKIEQEAIELKKISQDVTKRLLLCPIFSGCCQNNSIVGSTGNVLNQNWSKIPADSDKFSKKLPEQNLAHSFLLSAERLSILSPSVSKILTMLGETQNKLAIERLNWAANVENEVLEKLRSCYEEQVPSLVKGRRQLWKQNFELKVLQDRLKSLECNSNIVSPNSPILPHSSHSPNSQHVTTSQLVSEPQSQVSNSVLNSSLNCVSNSNTQNGQISSSHENSKLNQLKITRDELESQIDHLKDLSLKEHYRFESSIINISKAFLNLLKNEVNYHQQCLKTIGQVLPDIESTIANNPIPVFGRELNQHLITSGRHIAYVLEVCMRHLDNPGTLCEEGLFRIAGGKNKVDTLSSAFNVFRVERIIKYYDHFVIADCLKQYLRSLPEPLLTSYLFDDWMRAVNNDDEDGRLAQMKTCLKKLPVAYFNNLSYLIGFLAKLSTFSDKNKMTPANLGIIFGPNLLSADSSSSGLYKHSISSTNTMRKKMKSVSNASQMMKKQSYNEVNDNSKNFYFTEINEPIDDSMKNGKQNNRYEEDSMSKSMIASNNHCLVIEILISNFNYFFPNQCTQFSSNIPPKVFPNNYRSKCQNSFNGVCTNECSYTKHKMNLTSSTKTIQSIDCNNEINSTISSTSQSLMSNQYSHNVSTDSSIKTDISNPITKSLATTPTSKTTSEFRNGTFFPSCIYRRRVSDGTINNLKTMNNDNFIGSLDISDLPDIDSSCIDDCQSSSAKSSNDCEDFMDTSSIVTLPIDSNNSESRPTCQSAKYVPKSFHADVYDTLFALQSLNSYAASTDDYLSRVRSVYEERILAKPSERVQTPLTRRQTINSTINENSMSKSVTDDSTLKYLNIPSKSKPPMFVIRKPSNVKLKHYRESSPATIQTISTDSLDKLENVTNNFSTVKCDDTPVNKLSMNAENNKMPMISLIRSSMPILPAKGLNKTDLN